MQELKRILKEIENYQEIDSTYCNLCAELMDRYWKIRKNYPYGEKVIAILFYHDFFSDIVNLRHSCFALEGMYDKNKHRKDIFPNWDEFIMNNRKEKERLSNSCVIKDSIKNIKQFIELGYLPSFSGYYKKQYLTFVLDKEFGDYKIDLSQYQITDDFSKNLYHHILENIDIFTEEVRNY